MIRRTGRLVIPLMLGALLISVSGCGALRFGTGGDLQWQNQAAPERSLASQFDTGLYSYDGEDTATIVLLQGPVDAPRQAVTVRLFWRPWAGNTPVDPNATNATVRLIDFTGSQDGPRRVAVYSGAGFVYPRNTVGQATLRAGLWDATLRLTDVSTGQEAARGESTLTGGITVERDDARVQQLLRKLNSHVTDALNYPRMVRSPARAQRPSPIHAR